MDILNQGSLIGEKKSRIVDDYSISKRLGKGAYSEVFLAKQKQTGLTRCIKVTRKRNLTVTSEDAIFDEVKILKELDHPNIMKIYEYYQDSQNIYIVSEYLSGGELFDRIVASKHFNERTAASLMEQVLSAVSYLHKHNVIHRDLKPENMVFESPDPEANLNIIDFGTSKKVNFNEKLKAKLGTAYYIAPEVLKNNYDLKCDIWSCGVILYVFLCGYPPFNAKSDEEIFKRILKGQFTFPPEEWSTVSNEAKDLVTKMLTFEPSKRPFADDLLKHPWFSLAHKNAPTKDSNVKVLNNLSGFFSNYKLQKAVLIYFVNFFDIKTEKTRLLQAFKELDKDKDGQISKEELMVAYSSVSSNPMIDREVDEVLKKLDFNNTSAIDFSEFLVANVDYKQSLNQQKLQQIFSIIDKDKNGFITVEELKEFLNIAEDKHDAFVKQMMNEVDKNKDGVISFDEFEGMMNEFIKRF